MLTRYSIFVIVAELYCYFHEINMGIGGFAFIILAATILAVLDSLIWVMTN